MCSIAVFLPDYRTFVFVRMYSVYRRFRRDQVVSLPADECRVFVQLKSSSAEVSHPCAPSPAASVCHTVENIHNIFHLHAASDNMHCAYIHRNTAKASVLLQGTPKSNPLGNILYLWNCSRFFSPNLQHLEMRVQATYPANFIKTG